MDKLTDMGWPASATTRWPPLPHWCAARDWNEASCPGYGTSDIEPVMNISSFQATIEPQWCFISKGRNSSNISNWFQFSTLGFWRCYPNLSISNQSAAPVAQPSLHHQSTSHPVIRSTHPGLSENVGCIFPMIASHFSWRDNDQQNHWV